eukprot:CAMPEP_0170527322 /NCGR_PEP_ID=MMETSP0209-20121228/12812_1 /TAXON_ID=665100 ORGANISM="Litonotus pictus, Strain P1" /NCGR_SAMPLE_ID=MMETSP0209 /ASSEMBLY_ACC=CAM_ASM_000301 /LENGTH=339 /DNA_ID=CAMNT_0010817795 /DNA_START=209 /DNA_END=1228 /DNA_ORIENTATION=+
MNDGKSLEAKKEIESMSLEYDGMFKFAAIDCQEFSELCNKNEVREFPSYKIFPPLPAPVFPYEGDIKSKAIISSLGRFVDNKTIEVHSNNVDSFTNDNANLPKILLFSDKAGVPLIFKVLAVQFDKKITFGVVRKSESTIVNKYKVTKFPRIVALPVGAKKHQTYEGENKFKNLFDFVNVYSETFFKVGEDKTKASEETKADKPWLNEKLPELNNKSGNDVCFKVEGVICVVLVSNGKPENKIIDIMSELQNYLSPKIDRGIKYKFGWINSETQSQFLEATGVSSVPKIVLVNPGKRKRFYVSDEELNLESLPNVFDKLASGDLRFKVFPGNNVPELAE